MLCIQFLSLLFTSYFFKGFFLVHDGIHFLNFIDLSIIFFLIFILICLLWYFWTIILYFLFFRFIIFTNIIFNIRFLIIFINNFLLFLINNFNFLAFDICLQFLYIRLILQIIKSSLDSQDLNLRSLIIWLDVIQSSLPNHFLNLIIKFLVKRS